MLAPRKVLKQWRGVSTIRQIALNIILDYYDMTTENYKGLQHILMPSAGRTDLSGIFKPACKDDRDTLTELGQD